MDEKEKTFMSISESTLRSAGSAAPIHLNAASGLGDWPEGHALLASLMHHKD